MIENKQVTASLVKRVRIEGLFEQFTYDLSPQAAESSDYSLFLLYGDNGAGKSTILRLMFHLLNPDPFGGHRTFVSQIPFCRIEIELTSGLVLSASKKEPFNKENYSIRLVNTSSGIDIGWEWKSESKEKADEEVYGEYCNELKKAGLAFHFLSDSRKVAGLDEEHRRRFMKARGAWGDDSDDFRISIEADEHGHLTTELLVKDAVDRTIQWFQQQALSGTNVGYTSVNTIYSELIRRFVEPDEDQDSNKTHSIEELRQRLSSLAFRNAQFSSYGLTPELEKNTIDALLQNTPPQKIEVLNTILQPYLDGHNARLDALQEVQRVIDNFVSVLSEFFSRKTVVLDVQHELDIVTQKDRHISPEYLSSGEKQLLLLLCNAITARKNGTILIIDEPEISLNIKWQRKLIQALLTCLEGVDSQIILATHSIEILSKHECYVSPLNDISENSA